MEQNSRSRGFVFLTTRLVGELKRFRCALFFSCLLLLFSSLSGLGSGYLLGRFADSVLAAGGGVPFPWLLPVVIGAALLFDALNHWYWGRLQCHTAFELRKKTVEKMNRLRYSWIEAQSTGDAVVRLNSDLDQLLGFYGQFRTIFVSFLTGLLSLGLLVLINPLLALGYLLFPLAAQWCIYVWSGGMDPLFRKRQEYFGQLAAVSQEFLGVPLEVKAMNLEKNFIETYRDKLRVFTNHLLVLDRRGCKTDTALEAMGLFQAVSFLILGGFLVFAGKISPGELLTARIVAGNIDNAVKSLNFFQLRQVLPAAFRIFEIWDEDEAPAVGRLAEEDGEDAIVFDHVGFVYPRRPETEVLRNLSFSIRRGMKAAILGPNGSGKSSVLKLIAGLYAPTEGTVLVSGKRIAMIEQDTFLFSGTFSRNIACGEAVSGGRLTDAAKKAAIHDFIVSGKDGYAGEISGGALSGGQRQRLSIARALYRDAGIILLDEPTSALDRETETALMNTFREAFADKTVIMITHTPDLVRDFDRIYLMENGEIVDSGTHGELLRSGLYRALQERHHE
ncbi:MAG: ABC transporter ATP-binding protein/permease [Treponema sp.]|jgi:ABC-type multidrug transport system fused ATPase/permease subunit|nr:ABC transporter ATP-binding protein/permease [Treponema sp.]